MESKRSNIPLYLLMLVFIMPAIVAGVCLKYRDKIDMKLTAHGTLVTPYQTLSLKENSNMHLDSKWHVFYVAGSMCDEKCMQQKRDLAAMQILLGPNFNRVNLAEIHQNQVNNKLESDHMIIIDPRGQYVFDYAKGTSAKDILADLKKLLKYSKG